jgi:hypothetical protein
LAFLDDFIFQEEGLVQFGVFIVLVLLKQNEGESVFLEDSRGLEGSFCGFDGLHVLEKGFEDFFLVGRVVLGVFDVFEFGEGEPGTGKHELDELAESEEFSFFGDGLLNVASFFEEVVVGRFDDGLVNKIKRGSADEFGVDFEVLHHFKQSLERLIGRVFGIELGRYFISKINLR